MTTPPPRPDREEAALRRLVAGQLPAAAARVLRARIAADPALLARFGALSAAGGVTGAGGQSPTERRGRRVGAVSLRAAVLACTVLLIVGAGLIGLAVAVAPPTAAARPEPSAAPQIRNADLAELWPGVAGRYDFAVLGSAQRAETCIGLGFGGTTILGAMPVVVDGRYGVLVAHTGPLEPDSIALDVLGRGCAGGLGQSALASATVPR